jgi:NodT family efflux transporter outer membrane factor (OMF) lipoprotein
MFSGYFRIHRSSLAAGLFLVCHIALLSGCAPIPPNGQSPEMKPADRYEADQSFSAPLREWPDEKWWKGYHDRQLDGLIEEALQHSPSMTIAAARLRYAASLAQLAGSTLYPQVSADTSGTSQKLSYNYNMPGYLVPNGTHGYASMALNFSWELDFWGKNRAALKAATSEQQAATADMAQARLVLASSIASEYGELARLHAIADTVSSIVSVRGKNLELFEKRHHFGLETQANVEQAKARLASTEEEWLSLDKQIGLQRNKLAALIGAGPDRGLEIKPPELDLTASFALPPELQLDLLGRRPDIVAARLRVESTASSIEKQKAEFYPNINLSAFIGYQAMGLDKVFKSGSDFGGIGPAISLPIFTGGRLSAQLEGARAEHDEAIGLYNQTVTRALREVGDAALSRKKLIQQLEKIGIAAESARKAHRLIQNRYQGGLANYLEVLSAEETLLNTLKTQSDLQSQVFVLDVALVKALGGGYRMPEPAGKIQPATEK